VIVAVTHVKPVAPPPRIVPVAPVAARPAGLDPDQTCAPPQYPEEAADMEETGRTILQFLIDANGNVVKAIVARSSGHGLLDDTAERALAQCKFKPAIGSDGKPQESWATIPYDWQLN
jgi:TonB family protein